MKKIDVIRLITVFSILFLVLCFQWFMVRLHYNAGIKILNEWLDKTNDGRNPGFVDAVPEVDEFDEIQEHFKKCEKYAIFGIDNYGVDANIVRHGVDDLYLYKELLDYRPSYYSLDEWKEYREKIVFTKNKRLNKMMEIISLEIDAAKAFYDFDFDKAYLLIEPYKGMLPHFIEDMYFISISFEIISKSDLKEYSNNWKDLESIYVFRKYQEQEFGYCPLIVVNLRNDSKHYVLYPQNDEGDYILKESISSDYIKESKIYYYGEEKVNRIYIFDQLLLDTFREKSDEMSFLSYVPEKLQEE